MENRTLLELYEIFKQTISFYFTYNTTTPRVVLNFMYDNYFVSNIEYCRFQNDIFFRLELSLSIEFDYDMLIRFTENRIEQLK